MIIWGSKGRAKTIGRGEFHCPSCRHRRPYEHKQLGKYFTLYFIPIFKTKDLAEYVECQSCGTPYDPQILQSSVAQRGDDRAIDRIEHFMKVSREALDKGISLDALIAELQRNGLDREAATKVIILAAGPSLRKCPNCQLVYRDTVTYCSNCGTELRSLAL